MINKHKQELPDDAVLVKQLENLNFYFSKAGHAFFVETGDCHADPVKVSRAEIIELLNILDQQTAEKEKELLADLETDEDDF